MLCRQLGYPSGTVLGSSMFGQNRQLDILLDDVACTGTEASLAGCTYSAGGSDCGHFEDLGVECSSALNSAACPPACLPARLPACSPACTLRAVKYPHAQNAAACSPADTSSASPSPAPPPSLTRLRLVGGRGAFEGRLEVELNGVWGTVCDQGYSDEAAKVGWLTWLFWQPACMLGG